MRLAGLYRSHDNGPKVSMSITSSWKLVSFVVSYCSDKAECKLLFFVRHENTVDRLCTRCLVIL